jgi:hypothetical protein
MSKQYPGGLITKSPVTPSGPYANSTAPGVWTLEQQAYWQKQGQWPTAGAVNPNLFIENLYSTYLYSGNNSTQTITNGINLSSNGGMVWIKARSTTTDHVLFNTVVGASSFLFANGTSGSQTPSELTSFNSNGFSLSDNPSIQETNVSTVNYSSWSFQEQAKFFDVVTYTGTGSNTTIAHNLGSVPGCIMVKRRDSGGAWAVYHRSLANTEYLVLNTTAIKATGTTRWNSTTPTSTVFSLGTDATVNASGGTYVAYIFAHDAGGFGLTGTDNVISCGSYTGNGSTTGPVITLGYEPQWVLIKRADSGLADWAVFDTARGMSLTAANLLYPNSASDEGLGTVGWIQPTATGFQPGWTSSVINASGNTYIYVAIRKGPMQVPTVGTSVFTPISGRSSGLSQSVPIFNAGFPVDMFFTGSTAGGGEYWLPRLTVGQMTSSSTAAETSASATYNFGGMLGVLSATGDLTNALICGWNFRRAPSFFDVVCYTGTGSATTQTHNLAVVPEMMIAKIRSGADNWIVYHSTLGATKYVLLDSNGVAQTDSTMWNNTAPTASVFSLGSSPGTATNLSGQTYVAYLFATCAGVSKVGSYTGTGTTQQINCGFTSGARFVLIKRTSTGGGDWYVWDSARGIIAGNDPYLLLNSTAAEVTNTDYVDTYSAGFELSSTAPAAINANGGTFIFLAIA